MSEFNLTETILNWKKGLSKYKQLEPGDIEELEGHLIDAIEQLVSQGMEQQEAFKTASSRINAGFNEVVKEYEFTSSNHEPVNKWFSSWWIPSLLPNVLKITLRSFKRQPGYSFINILGLAIGMASCFVIYLFVQDEMSYDAFHEKSDRIYRVDQTLIWEDFNGYFSSTGPGIATTLKQDFAEIETTVRVQKVVDGLITIESESHPPQYFIESKMFSADSTFFDVFSIEFIEGNSNGALDLPYTVVITDKTRERYFDSESALGKSILLGNPGEEVNYLVTGVVNELPENSHFSFDLISSLTSNPHLKRRADTWSWTTFVTYVVLAESVTLQSFQEKLNSFVPEYAEAKIYPLFGLDGKSARENQKNYELFLTPLTDIHLNVNDSGNRFGPVGDIFYVYVFSSIALLIIALASINFMNLSSARSVQRSKEVGIRKTLGSLKSTLISQFLAEAILFTFIALIIAMLIVFLSIEPFNQIALKNLSFLDLFDPLNLILIITFTTLIGFITGIYPAFYLTSFNPIEAFKGKTSAISSNRFSFNKFRDALVILQFCISIMLISCSIIINQQLNYLQDKNLGFDKENVLIIQNVMKLGDQSDTFKQLIKSESGIIDVSRSNATPPYIWNEDFARVAGGAETEVSINSLITDSDFIKTMDIELLSGRNFEESTGANTNYVVINETAINQLPWPERVERDNDFPLGESFYFSGLDEPFEIIGIVKDFNINSLHSEIGPLALFHESSEVWKGPNRFLSIRISPNMNIPLLLKNVENNWNTLTNGLPFDFIFLDNRLRYQYDAEQRIGKVVNIFTGLAIFIALLGLLGLISFAIEKRTKEIGIRKVMGASSSRIVYLLSKDTLRLILVSIVVSIPLSWKLMEYWLQNFAFRVDINPLVFLMSGIAAIILAWAALSFQTIKAASQNPVKSLKSE